MDGKFINFQIKGKKFIRQLNFFKGKVKKQYILKMHYSCKYMQIISSIQISIFNNIIMLVMYLYISILQEIKIIGKIGIGIFILNYF